MPLMGRKRGKPKPAEHELAPWLKVYFMTGEQPVLDTPESHLYFQTVYCGEVDVLEKLWRRHRDALVAECVATQPGTRPYYWWLADCRDDFEDLPVENEPQESYRARLEAHERESEAFTLRRRGLLLPGELERIPATAFEPLAPEPEAA